MADELADVQRRIVGRGQLNPEIRTLGIDQFHALARGENNLARRRRDDAMVFNLGRDEVNEASVASLDRALVDYLAGTRHFVELVSAGEKVSVCEFQRTGDKTGGVDHRAAADEHAVRVD